MKKVLLYITGVLLPFAGVVAQNSQQPEYVANQFYFRLIDNPVQSNVEYIPHPDNPGTNTPENSVWNTIKAYGGLSMTQPFPASIKSMSNVYKVTLKEGSDMETLMRILDKKAEVTSVQKIPVYYLQAIPVELDPSIQWYFKNINMNESSWGIPRSAVKTIAVIDNGVRYTHEDLVGKIMLNLGEIPNNGIDDDNNFYVDDYYGWDVADEDSDPMASPLPPNYLPWVFPQYGSHGTHVAGIIAAADNNKGIASLGINNAVLCIKAHKNSDKDDRTIVNVCEAIAYAMERKVDIINCSFGFPEYDVYMDTLIKEAIQNGIVVVAAAGNSNNDNAFYPAALDGVIAVGATDQDNKKIKDSRYGNYIDVMAPGKDIFSTLSTGDDQYGYMTGTSMAAPIVSSFIGLILSSEPQLAPVIEKVLRGGCINIDANNSGLEGKLGAGLINVDETFRYVAQMSSVRLVNTAKTFTVYPNPASGEVFVPFTMFSPGGEPVTLTIYNSAGVQISTTAISYDNQPVDVSSLSQGIYNLAVTSDDGRLYNTRLLVNR